MQTFGHPQQVQPSGHLPYAQHSKQTSTLDESLLFKFDADVPYFTYPLLEFCCTQVTETPDEAAGNNAK
eukprot:g10257.t1